MDELDDMDDLRDRIADNAQDVHALACDIARQYGRARVISLLYAEHSDVVKTDDVADWLRSRMDEEFEHLFDALVRVLPNNEEVESRKPDLAALASTAREIARPTFRKHYDRGVKEGVHAFVRGE